jgi:hypothetical protein
VVVSSFAHLTGLGRPPPPLAPWCAAANGPARLGGLLPPLAVQPQRHLLRIPLGIQRKQPCKHVVADGIGPAIAPGEFAAAGDGAVGLQLALETEGIAGIPEEQLAAVDVFLQVFGKLGVFL